MSPNHTLQLASHDNMRSIHDPVYWSRLGVTRLSVGFYVHAEFDTGWLQTIN